MNTRSLGMPWAVLLGVLVGAPACNGWDHPAVHVEARRGRVAVTIHDRDGAPVAAARVAVAGRELVTADDGSGVLDDVLEGGYLVGVDAPGFEADTAAWIVSFPPGRDVARLERTLERAEPSDVRLAFGGDVSFDGGISDPNRDGITQDSLVPAGPAATGGAEELLAGLSPLFARFDLVTVNLASVLGDGATPHPRKPDRALAPESVAPALAAAGVSVVNVGNDHVYDYLDAGVAETLGALDRAALYRVGAGRDLAEATTPSLVPRRGLLVGQVSLSARVGRGTPPHPDALPLFTASVGKGGVVEADPSSVRDAVAQAQLTADVVVADLTAGQPWVEDTTGLEPLAAAAAGAGAAVVVGFGPRVLQPLFPSEGVLVAGGLGELVFGSNRPEARRGVLLEVRLRYRRFDRARVWPLVLVNYGAQLATGELGARVLRHVGALSQPRLLVYPYRGRGEVALTADGARSIDDSHGQALPLSADGVSDPVALVRGETEDFVAAVEATPASGQPGDLVVELGVEQLWEGGFEDETAGGPGIGRGAGWSYHAPDVGPTDAAVHQGRLAVEIVRKSGNLGPASVRGQGLTTLVGGKAHRFSGCWRAEGRARATAALVVYSSRAIGAPATGRVAVVEAEPAGEWSCFEAEYLSPIDTLVTPEVSLDPPVDGTARLFVDDLSLVAWDSLPGAAGQLPVPNEYEWARVHASSGGGSVSLRWVTRRFVPSSP